MKLGPNIVPIAALIGDPARANMLMALMSGLALTASELAQEAGISPSTASEHLTKLRHGGLLEVEKQGRHRYYRISNTDVASALEGLIGLAGSIGPQRTRPGPKEPALRMARACYDHLAGEMGVRLYENLLSKKYLQLDTHSVVLTARGEKFIHQLGIDIALLSPARRPLCRQCLDWSARRHHLAGSLGAAIFSMMLEQKWVRRDVNSRIVYFTRTGQHNFENIFCDNHT